MEILALAISILSIGLAILAAGFLEERKKKIDDYITETGTNESAVKAYKKTIPELYEEKGRQADIFVQNFSKKKPREINTSIDAIYKEVKSIDTHLGNILSENLLEKKVEDELYILESDKYIAKQMLKGINDNFDEFDKNTYKKHQEDPGYITGEEYLNILLGIVETCEEKYRELDKNYGEMIETVKEKKTELLNRIEQAIKE
ncbi:MAG: hypothetical protein U9P44_01255 [archaeon]|nr:hypothetical protein [archaeon]